MISNTLKRYILSNSVQNYKKYKNYDPKICIILHFFNKELLPEFIIYINNVISFFKHTNIIITMHDTTVNKYFAKNVLQKIFKTAIILFIENKGVDIGGLFTSLKHIRRYNIEVDFILKMHTKTSDHNWRKQLIKPLTNKHNLNTIKILLSLDNIGFIAAKNYVNRNDNYIYNGNRIGLEWFCNKYSITNGNNFRHFVGGTMFWIKYNVLNDLSNNMMDYLYSQFSYNKPIKNHITNKIQYEYIAERLLSGILCRNCVNIKIDKHYFDIV